MQLEMINKVLKFIQINPDDDQPAKLVSMTPPSKVARLLSTPIKSAPKAIMDVEMETPEDTSLGSPSRLTVGHLPAGSMDASSIKITAKTAESIAAARGMFVAAAKPMFSSSESESDSECNDDADDDGTVAIVPHASAPKVGVPNDAALPHASAPASIPDVSFLGQEAFIVVTSVCFVEPSMYFCTVLFPTVIFSHNCEYHA